MQMILAKSTLAHRPYLPSGSPKIIRKVAEMLFAVRLLGLASWLLGMVTIVTFFRDIGVIIPVLVFVTGFIISLVKLYVRLERLEWIVSNHSTTLQKLDTVPETLVRLTSATEDISARLDRDLPRISEMKKGD